MFGEFLIIVDLQYTMSSIITLKRKAAEVVPEDPVPTKRTVVDVAPLVKALLEEECFSDMLAEYLDGMVEDFVEEVSKKDRHKFMKDLPTIIKHIFDNMLLGVNHPLDGPYEGDMHDCICNTYTDNFLSIDELILKYPNQKEAIVAELVAELTDDICTMTQTMVDEASD
jgi:hypothetical protein